MGRIHAIHRELANRLWVSHDGLSAGSMGFLLEMHGGYER